MKGRVIVLGGLGIIGRELCRSLCPYFEVISADIAKLKDSDCSSPDEQYKYIHADILNKRMLVDLFQENDVVINLAAKSRISECNSDILGSMELNLVGAINVILAANEKGCSQVFLASSLYAKGHAGGFYSASKRALEDYVISFMSTSSVPLTLVRIGSVAGGIDDVNSLPSRIVRQFLDIAMIEGSINSRLVRDYLPLPAFVAQFEELILNAKYYNSIVEFSSGVQINTVELIEEVKSLLAMPDMPELHLENKGLDFNGQYIEKPDVNLEVSTHKILLDSENGNFLCHLKEMISEGRRKLRAK